MRNAHIFPRLERKRIKLTSYSLTFLLCPKRNAKRSHFPSSQTKTNKFNLINSVKKFSRVRSEMRNAHIFPSLKRKRIRTAHPSVTGTAMKRRIHRHPTHPDQRSLKPKKLIGTLGHKAEPEISLFWFEVVLAASRCLPKAASCSYHVIRSLAERIDFCRHVQFIAGLITFSPVSLIPVRNNQAAKHLSPVSMTPPISFSPVSCQYQLAYS
jgi:hypothetical protein